MRPKFLTKLVGVLVGLALTVTGLAGCGDSRTASSLGICVDSTTHVRVPDSQCEHRSFLSHSKWYYLGYGALVPAIGAAAHGGSFRTPTHTYVRGGAPRSGGKASSVVRKQWDHRTKVKSHSSWGTGGSSKKHSGFGSSKRKSSSHSSRRH